MQQKPETITGTLGKVWVKITTTPQGVAIYIPAVAVSRRERNLRALGKQPN
jgi:hypothetical protein